MKNRKKLNIKISLMSIVFSVISLISVTLAWFVYSGMSKASIDVNVKAWYIELSKDGEKISNQIVISLEDIYPGMDVYSEEIKIKNLGDSDAQVKYSIDSVRIFNSETNTSGMNSNDLLELEDSLSHNYPFHVNLSLKKEFILAKSDETSFNVSISWPLDSGNDELDSYWGTEAYSFQNAENEMKQQDQQYSIRPSVKIVIDLTAEQYIEDSNSLDLNYPLGKNILYDVSKNEICENVSSTCLNTHIIDTNNKISDQTVSLLPDIESTSEMSTYDDYDSTFNSKVSNWNVNARRLVLSDLLYTISKDVVNSVIVSDNLSDYIVGNVRYNNRLQTQISSFSTNNKYYKFSNEFTWLLSSDCYWINTDYNNEKMFATISNMEYSTIYGESKANRCKVVPVIVANKSNLQP